MSRKAKTYEDDDGRTIADMRGVGHPALFFPRRAPARREDPAPSEQSGRPWEQPGMSREDRRSYIWGALAAALLIALVFIVGLGIVIALMYWKFSQKL